MEIDKILQKNGFRFNKSLGQNFLTDKNLLAAIVSDAGVENCDTVVEIGAGAGTLTSAIAEKAKKVYAFEVDRRLKPVLEETLKDFSNVELVFSDVLKMKDEEFLSIVGEPFKVVANLPYYVTTPMLMRFVESGLQAVSVTATVQKEVAERFAAKENTEDYGAITVQLALRGNTKITRYIGRKMFYPVPNVDSAVVLFDAVKGKFPNADLLKCSKLVKCAFAMRRKTLINNLSAQYPLSKEELKSLLRTVGLNENVRGETLSAEQFVELSAAFETLRASSDVVSDTM